MNRVDLNLGAAGREGPIEGEPPIKLNGEKLDFVLSIELKASASALTEVTIRLLADVTGAVVMQELVTPGLDQGPLARQLAEIGER